MYYRLIKVYYITGSEKKLDNESGSDYNKSMEMKIKEKVKGLLEQPIHLKAFVGRELGTQVGLYILPLRVRIPYAPPIL